MKALASLHNVLDTNHGGTLATQTSTGVTSGPTELLHRASAAHRPAHSSRRGPDNDISPDCARLNSSESE